MSSLGRMVNLAALHNDKTGRVERADKGVNFADDFWRKSSRVTSPFLAGEDVLARRGRTQAIYDEKCRQHTDNAISDARAMCNAHIRCVLNCWTSNKKAKPVCLDGQSAYRFSH